LRQVEGIGPLTALTFVLTVEDPYRFERSRCVGAYLGLVPARDQSGDRDPQKRISKEGDEMLRRLLVSSAHYILGPWLGLGPKTSRTEDSLPRSQELKETSGGGCSEEALCATASVVGYSRGIRATAQHPPLRRPKGGGLENL
jgi:hypothetical protein